tara:strand:+ start:139 stop:378 length:240 start_codon:yes stop_codon:yes gene_type:complete
MKQNHMITVSDDQSRIARAMPNFSAFVQECLRMHSNGELDIDMSKLNLRKREIERMEYETAIERRLTNIEKLLSRIVDD